jgi:pyruvate formate lyase activating enzyme
MKEAIYWKPLKEDAVKCELCPHRCVIKPGKSGICGARKNTGGKLFSLNYGRPVSVAADPIEKKPLFHFLPGSSALSFGTYGCNLGCQNCQNFDISMERNKQSDKVVSPELMIELAIANNCQSIAYTYNEPTIYYEYMLDCAKLARAKGIKNVMVSNGYIEKQPLIELCKHMDAANIDLKAFNPDFYITNCKATLEPVKEALKILKQQAVWLEITNLVIPGLSDNLGELESMSKWIAEELGKAVPLHLSKFFPLYKLSALEPTPEKTLEKARQIARKYLDYVYVGNLPTLGFENTSCPKCKKLLIERKGYMILKNSIKEGSCPSCNTKIPGLWA